MNIAIIILLITSIFTTGSITITTIDDREIKININWFSLIVLILVLIKFYN